MSDPFETLKQLDAGATLPPLPATEVRRRGDRMRHRRTGLQALGGAAVLTLVVSSGLLAGRHTGAAPVPVPATQAPSVSASASATAAASAQRLPDGFPLGAGLPDPGGDVTQTRSDDLTTAFALDPCLARPKQSSDAGRTDFREIRQSVVDVTGYVRQVAVYGDAKAASAAYGQLAQALRDCPTTDYGGGSVDQWLTEQARLAGADTSLTAAADGFQDGRATTQGAHWILVRVGNAVLLLGVDGEILGGESSLDAIDFEQRAHAARIVAAMCGFSADGCRERPALTATGYGDLKIGMSAQEVATSPEVKAFDPDRGGACRGGSLVDGGGLSWSRNLGLVAIWLGGAMDTPEGISLASTEADVRRAYPQGSMQQGYWVVPLGSGVEYEFGFEADGSVSEALLTSTDQDCFD